MKTAQTALIGRILMALLFLMSGLSKLGAAGATIGYIASVGLPLPSVAFAGALLVEIGGGLLLLLGYRVSVVAAVLAAFSVVTALAFHSNFGDQNQIVHFLKNFAIAGGLLQLVAVGAPSLSLDARRLQRA